MTTPSSSPAFQLTYQRAEEAIERRRARLTFPTARRALGWMFEAGLKMQAPHGMHPKTSPVSVMVDGLPRPTDERVLVQVEGGEGGDLDEVFATLSTINRALNDCQRDFPRGCSALVLIVRDGRSQASIADEHKLSQTTVSAEVGKADAYLTGVLRAAGVLR